MSTALVPQQPAPLIHVELPFDHTILAGQLAPSSIRMYRRDFLAYLAFCDSVPEALEPATLGRWRTHLAKETQKSPHTINRMLAAVKRLIKEAAGQGHLKEVLTRKWSWPSSG
jgi:integrase/recombinase XerD